jgi:hypothetical protein
MDKSVAGPVFQAISEPAGRERASYPDNPLLKVRPIGRDPNTDRESPPSPSRLLHRVLWV